MKNMILLYLLLFFLTNLFGQSKNTIDPDQFLIGNKQLPKVLLVGSWHFDYPGLDANVTDEKSKINIYSEKRQKELQELLNYIGKFKPTKIIVESGPITGYLKYNYNQWKLGKEELKASEMSQVGMRLVEMFKLDTIYGCNDYPLLLDMHYDSSLMKTPYLDSIYRRHYFGGQDTMQKKYTEFYKYEKEYELYNTLLNSFKYINSDKVLNRYNGAYLAGGQFASIEKEGPDALSMFWVNRNLRIFRNIQQIETTSNDRIVVIFGTGHIAMLKWFFESSPEFELVKFNELENYLSIKKKKSKK